MAYEPASDLEAVEALYIGYFGRAGEPGGVNYWVDRMEDGMSFAEVAASFSAQPEAKAQHPFLADPEAGDAEAFVASLYSQLLNRDDAQTADPTGFNYWVDALEAADGDSLDIGLLIAQFISGAQGIDIQTIQNKVAGAIYFTQELEAAGISGVDSKGQATAEIKEIGAAVIDGIDSTSASVEDSKDETDAYLEDGTIPDPSGGGGNPGPGPGPGPGPNPPIDPVALYDEDGKLVDRFTTIQNAVNEAENGYEIRIASGTYTEQVTVAGFTGLTIREAAGANVIVRAPTDLVQTGRSDGRAVDLMAIVQVTNSTDVNISGITVDGDDGRAVVGGASMVGIAYQDSSGAVDGVTVIDIRDPDGGGTGVQRGFGILFDGGDYAGTQPANVNALPSFSVTNSTISAFQKGAIYVYDGDITITGNTMTGGSETIAQNGVVAFGSTGTVSGNTVNNIGYPSGTSDSGFIGINNLDLDVTNIVINAGGGNVTAVSIQTSSGGTVDGVVVNGSEVDDFINLGTGNSFVYGKGGSDTAVLSNDAASTTILYTAVSESGFGTTSIDTLDLRSVTQNDPVTIRFDGSDFNGARQALETETASPGALLFSNGPTIGPNGVAENFFIEQFGSTHYLNAYVRTQVGQDISYMVYVDSNGDGDLGAGDMQFRILGEISVNLMGVYETPSA